MAEPNTLDHRWHQRRFHIRLALEDFSREYIYDSGIARIDAHIVSVGGWVLSNAVWTDNGVWLDSQGWNDGV